MAIEATAEGCSTKPSEPFTFKDVDVSALGSPWNDSLAACAVCCVFQPAIASEQIPLTAGHSAARGLNGTLPNGSVPRCRDLPLRRHTTFLDCGGCRSCPKGECTDCIQQPVSPQAYGLACRACTSIAAASRFEGMFGLRMRWRDSIRSHTAAHRRGVVVTGWRLTGGLAPPRPGICREDLLKS